MKDGPLRSIEQRQSPHPFIWQPCCLLSAEYFSSHSYTHNDDCQQMSLEARQHQPLGWGRTSLYLLEQAGLR